MVTAAPQGLVLLESLRAGQTARVESVVGPVDHVHRLAEIGVSGGTELVMFRPGRPCILRLAGIKVGLRTDAALRVFVRPLGS